MIVTREKPPKWDIGKSFFETSMWDYRREFEVATADISPRPTECELFAVFLHDKRAYIAMLMQDYIAFRHIDGPYMVFSRAEYPDLANWRDWDQVGRGTLVVMYWNAVAPV